MLVDDESPELMRLRLEQAPEAEASDGLLGADLLQFRIGDVDVVQGLASGNAVGDDSAHLLDLASAEPWDLARHAHPFFRGVLGVLAFVERLVGAAEMSLPAGVADLRLQ